MAEIGGIGLNTQGRYEAGGTLPAIEYLARIAEHGADWHWILTGQKSASALGEDQSDLVSAFDELSLEDRDILLRLACSMAGRPRPTRSFSLPAPADLVQAFEQFLEVTPTNDRAELLRELAMSLPTILQAVEGVTESLPTNEPGVHSSHRGADNVDRPAARPARRS